MNLHIYSVDGKNNPADIFTKSLTTQNFQYLVKYLSSTELGRPAEESTSEILTNEYKQYYKEKIKKGEKLLEPYL